MEEADFLTVHFKTYAIAQPPAKYGICVSSVLRDLNFLLKECLLMLEMLADFLDVVSLMWGSDSSTDYSDQQTDQ